MAIAPSAIKPAAFRRTSVNRCRPLMITDLPIVVLSWLNCCDDPSTMKAHDLARRRTHLLIFEYDPAEVIGISSALYLSRCRARLYLPELSGKRAYDLTLVIDEVAMKGLGRQGR